MKALLAKIEANARVRLVLPPGRTPTEETARYRSFLKEEAARIRIVHRGGADGLTVCRARSVVVDCLLRSIWDGVRASLPPEGTPPRVALVAFGGYGRAELCPFSDIDLMVLHAEGFDPRGRKAAVLKAWTSALLPLLWDVGLKVGHSSRTVDECITVANRDMQAKTSLLEARCVTGDEPLFRQFSARFDSECVAGFEQEYIRERLADQAARRTRHGNSPAMQEPNVKNGCGGLRDYQNLLWMVAFRLKLRTLEELQSAGFISAAERKQLAQAHEFLLRVRNELHYEADRALDTLTALVKPAVALGLGYDDESPRTRVERFMRDYYTHTRNIHWITRTIEQRLALAPAPARGLRRLRFRRRAAPPESFDGFEVVEGQITAGSPGLFREDPFRMIRLFLHAQQRGLPVHPALAQLLRQSVASGLVNGAFMASAHARNTFLEILSARGNVAPWLRLMHDVGFLGKLIPEFGRLTNLVQHEFYHQYAVDEHTLVCLEKLDRVWDAAEAPSKNYEPLLRSLERPFTLYLALLLHDSGKALPGERHEVVGGRLAQRAGNRLHLAPETTATLRLIIENHLVMVQTSQRRDLDDPEVIRRFALQVGSVENLDMLTLHTFADSMGTSDTLWNGFKDSLLWQLRNRTRNVLSGGSEFIRAEQIQRERLREETQALLPKTFADDEVEAHFTGLPPRYYHVHGPREIARDLLLAHRFMHLQLSQQEVNALAPVIIWRDDADRGYALVHVCTWDRPGLFASLTGAMAAAGLTILTAQIYTRADGVVFDDFSVADARTGAVPDPQVHERFDRLALQILTGKLSAEKAVAQAPRYAPRYRPVGDDAMAPEITLDNEVSGEHTVIDLVAEDRLGLLFDLSSALYDLGIDLVLAKIVTEKGAAIDSFYVLDRASGAKLVEPARQAAVIRRLRAAVGKPAAGKE